MTHRDQPELILASNSTARRSMLRHAGLKFSAQPSDIDEKSHKVTLAAGGVTAKTLAAELAMAKAGDIASQKPLAWVIGADQVLVCEDEFFDKAENLSAAGEVLQRLSGRCHELHAAVSILCGDRVLWQHTDVARMWMRPLSDQFIEAYLDQAGPSVLGSVGCYQIEGLGVQLFERIEGDHFTIMGLPLLPLLNYLHSTGVISR